MPKIVWALWVFNPFLSLSLYYFMLSFLLFHAVANETERQEVFGRRNVVHAVGTIKQHTHGRAVTVFYADHNLSASATW